MSILRSQPVAVAVSALACLALLGALLYLVASRHASRWAGLVGGGVSLALLLPALTTGLASWRLIFTFGQTAESGGNPLPPLCRDLWVLQRLAWGAVAVFCLLVLAASVLRKNASLPDRRCSLGRAVTLTLLPLFALGGTALLARELYKALRITVVVMTPIENPARQRFADTVLQAEGIATEGPGVLKAITNRVTRATMRGSWGAITMAVVLLALSVIAFALAWQVRPPGWLVGVACALWLLVGTGAALVATGLVHPLRGLT